MAAENLHIDQNSRWTLGAVTNDVNEEIRNVRVNPVTGAMIVEAVITSTNTQIGSTIPGGTEGSILFLGPGSTLDEDPTNFVYFPSTVRMGLGTNTPLATFHLVGTLKMDLGGDALGDMFYRNSLGFVVRLPIGTTNQVISAVAGIPTWVSLTSVIGGYDTVQDDGVSVAQRTILNFVNYFTVTDASSKTNVSINVVQLANDTTFINTLTSNSTFISNINNNNSIQINLTTQVTGILPVVHGGTGAATLTGVLVGNGTSAITGTAIAQGDLFYGSATGVLSALTKSTSATRYLSNTGTSNNPAWAQINLTNGVTGQLSLTSQVTGVLPLANGGTASALSDPNYDAAYVWDNTTNTTRLAHLSGITYNTATNTLTSSGNTGGAPIMIPVGKTTVTSGVPAGSAIGSNSFVNDATNRLYVVTSNSIGADDSSITLRIFRNEFGTYFQEKEINISRSMLTNTGSGNSLGFTVWTSDGSHLYGIIRYTSNTAPFTRIDIVRFDLDGTNPTATNIYATSSGIDGDDIFWHGTGVGAEFSAATVVGTQLFLLYSEKSGSFIDQLREYTISGTVYTLANTYPRVSSGTSGDTVRSMDFDPTVNVFYLNDIDQFNNIFTGIWEITGGNFTQAAASPGIPNASMFYGSTASTYPQISSIKDMVTYNRIHAIQVIGNTLGGGNYEDVYWLMIYNNPKF